MSQTGEILKITLLDKELKLRCPAEKMEDLQKAVDYVDAKMREIRDSGKAFNHEKIIQMTALNLAYDLIALQKQNELYLENMSTKIRELAKKLDSTGNS